MAAPNPEFERILEIDLPEGQSTFLWGARKTGKSSYLEKHFPDSIYYDLLKTDEFIRLMRHPHRLREEVLAISERWFES